MSLWGAKKVISYPEQNTIRMCRKLYYFSGKVILLSAHSYIINLPPPRLCPRRGTAVSSPRALWGYAEGLLRRASYLIIYPRARGGAPLYDLAPLAREERPAGASPRHIRERCPSLERGGSDWGAKRKRVGSKLRSSLGSLPYPSSSRGGGSGRTCPRGKAKGAAG